ncbi:hypothetical protein IHE45_18G069300 [Dioscorea alata]|uniref:Uncharacterized protein n=1 Tax=Dioscorea alata TaxID=55571 RepID=A0ACB7U7T7_DIOAL|nr:hypothetical protein IHE45_18G069300 [Dioscorea alata]
MATVTLACPTTTTFETKCLKNNHEDSFSSYLSLIRESLAKELGDSSPTPTTMRVSIGKRRNENGELDVFQAEKYFSGLMDEDHSEKSFEKTTGTEKNLYKKEGKNIISLKSRSGTESSCSEASGNSRSTLLRDSRRKSTSGDQHLKKSSSKKFLGVFRCSCAGKDDIKADEEHHHSPNHATEFLTERIVLGLKREGVAIGALSSPFIEKPVISSSWKQGSPAGFVAAGGGGGCDNDDDVHSESSSDLFEIESLNLSIHVHPLFNPEPAYEPSEASIEWSVATASVANDDHRKIETMKKAIKNHKTGLLSGCADSKAVSVHTHDTDHQEFEKPERVNSGRDDHRFALQDLTPVARYHASQAIYTR